MNEKVIRSGNIWIRGSDRFFVGNYKGGCKDDVIPRAQYYRTQIGALKYISSLAEDVGRWKPRKHRCGDQWCDLCRLEYRLRKYQDSNLNALYKSRFKADSHAKRLTRIAIYSEISKLLNQKNITVLMLAGNHPEHEISVAKRFLCIENEKPRSAIESYTYPITAIDLDRSAVDRAKSAGANSFWYNISHLRFSGDTSCWPLPNAPSTMDFVNLDLCNLVTSEGICDIVERALFISRRFLATWFSYGHDDLTAINNTARRELAPSSFDFEWKTKYFKRIPETITKRLLHIWHRAHHPLRARGRHSSMHLIRVWSYRGGRMPMFCALWDTNPRENIEEVPYSIISGKPYRENVLLHADEFGSMDAANLFGCTLAQIAAWKAVRTKSLQSLTLVRRRA